MHITLEADYAVRIVNCLAQNGGRMDAKQIAEKTGVSLRFSLKILRKLVANGITRSFKGTQGGYELTREPIQITLREVIEAIEGTYSISKCLSSDEFVCTCDRDERDCYFQKVYYKISQLVRDELDAVTFQSPEITKKTHAE